MWKKTISVLFKMKTDFYVSVLFEIVEVTTVKELKICYQQKMSPCDTFISLTFITLQDALRGSAIFSKKNS